MNLPSTSISAPAGVEVSEMLATLDAAVAAAYGWPADIPEDEALARLLARNLEKEPA